MKLPLFSLLCLLLPATVHAASSAGPAITFSRSWTGSLPVPDNDATGVSSTINFAVPGMDRIEGITVALQFSGGWNGDLYAYVVHNGQLAVLLNRPGRTATNDAGSGSTSLIALFDDTAAGTAHDALPDSGIASGVFQPDGRLIDPLLALDSTPRTNLLGGFNTMDPNGDWTLFIADQGAGDTATLVSWALSVTAVPEPSTPLLLGVAALTLAASRRRGALRHRTHDRA